MPLTAVLVPELDLVKEITRYGGDVSGLVPEPVLSQLHVAYDTAG
jgi:hypothetical protein